MACAGCLKRRAWIEKWTKEAAKRSAEAIKSLKSATTKDRKVQTSNTENKS